MENQQQEQLVETQQAEATQDSETKDLGIINVAEGDPNKTYMTDQFIDQANATFHAALQEIKKSKVSRGGVLRALDFAMTKNLSARSLKIKPKTEAEGKLAEMIILANENRLILIASQLRAKEQEELKKLEQISKQGDLNVREESKP